MRPDAVRAIICLCLLVGFVIPASGVAQTQNAAGIVVDYGDGRMTYAYVPFVEEEISGLELLRRSGVPLVTVSFGGLGDGVCKVGDTGCDVSECRRRLCQTGERTSPFWQYVRQEAPGDWRLFPLGVSQSRVRNGDIDGWAWTGTQPRLPAMTFENLTTQAGGGGADAAVRTVGGDALGDDDSAEPWRLLAGVGVLVGVASGGWLLVWRSRRVPGGAAS
ncbi:MAG: hypothetical protein M3121_08525 [Chloroflexota bacterium]|nr:hypothetical protein [Chloroflexota bacterium]